MRKCFSVRKGARRQRPQEGACYASDLRLHDLEVREVTNMADWSQLEHCVMYGSKGQPMDVGVSPRHWLRGNGLTIRSDFPCDWKSL